jgi:hypothetical protein
MAQTIGASLTNRRDGLHGEPMADGTRVRRDEAEGGREPLRLERARVDAPPGLPSAQLAFPWASSLAIGWGPPPARARPPRDVPPAPRRKPVGE